MDTSKRFWEIDFLRGVAVIMMIVFHFLYDLDYFSIYRTELWTGTWLIFERITATIFILLVGLSLTLSYSRTNGAATFAKYLKRGTKIFCLGLIITAITWFLLPQEFIIFGVLHFIGVAVVLGYFFVKRKNANLVLGIIVVAIGLLITNIVVDFPWLLWTGLHQSNFYTLDYFPLLPWFGVVLIGMFFGKFLYSNYKRTFSIHEATNPLARFLSFIGRHSLIIYLLHQPVLIAILYLLM